MVNEKMEKNQSFIVNQYVKGNDFLGKVRDHRDNTSDGQSARPVLSARHTQLETQIKGKTYDGTEQISNSNYSRLKPENGIKTELFSESHETQMNFMHFQYLAFSMF